MDDEVAEGFLSFKPGEKILVDRTTAEEHGVGHGYLYGRIGNREGFLPDDPELIQI